MNRNDDTSHFSWSARAQSFKYAFKGIYTLIKQEHNARIHLCAAIIAIILGVILHLSSLEWCIISLCIGGVFMAEALNSAIEALCDKTCKEYDLLIKKAKDVASAGVLFFALAALVCGIIIYLPKLIKLVTNLVDCI